MKKMFITGISILVLLTLAFSSLPASAQELSLHIEDQEIYENTINIASIDLEQEGWVVIHPVIDGQPDTSIVLGKQLVTSDNRTDTRINLDCTLFGDTQLSAMIYMDDPADQQFTYSSDNGEDQPFQLNGSPLIAYFTITIQTDEQPSIRANDQVLSAGIVTISEVIIDQPGWIILHSATGDNTAYDSDIALGQQYIDAGNHSDVQVIVTGNVSDEGNISAILHYDDPSDQQFTYTPENDEDPAVQVDGQDVLTTFILSTEIQTGLEVEDQYLEDSIVTIATVSINSSAWLVIHPVDDQDEVTRQIVIGHQYMEPGEYTDMQVPINYDIQEDIMMAAVLYHYDPDNPVFDHEPGTEIEARPFNDNLTRMFTVRMPVETAIQAEDQVLDENGTVILAEVVSGYDGWVVLHPVDSASQPVSTIGLGSTYIQRGESENVSVEVTAYLTADTPVVVMLHEDNPADQELTFIVESDDDQPVLVNNSPVMVAFTIMMEETRTIDDILVE